jgi:excisionase family DNA binding protein
MEELFTIEEAGAYLKVARPTLYKYMERGVGGVKLGYVYVGGERRIPRSAIEAFIKASTDRQKIDSGDTMEDNILIPGLAAEPEYSLT